MFFLLFVGLPASKKTGETPNHLTRFTLSFPLFGTIFISGRVRRDPGWLFLSRRVFVPGASPASLPSDAENTTELFSFSFLFSGREAQQRARAREERDAARLLPFPLRPNREKEFPAPSKGG